MKNAFTLLEILVVLAISAVIMSLGTYSLIRFRNFTQVQNAYSNVTSLLKQQQNKAKNSIASEAKLLSTGSISDSVPDYYAVFFLDNDYNVYYCDKQGDGRVNCFVEVNTEIQGKNTNSIDFELSCPNNSTGIGFESLTGDIIAIDISGNLSTTGLCILNVSHNQFGGSKVVQINLDQNNIVLE